MCHDAKLIEWVVLHTGQSSVSAFPSVIKDLRNIMKFMFNK